MSCSFGMADHIQNEQLHTTTDYRIILLSPVRFLKFDNWRQLINTNVQMHAKLCPSRQFTRQLEHRHRCCLHDDFRNTAPELLDDGNASCFAPLDRRWSKQPLPASEPSTFTEVSLLVLLTTADTAASFSDVPVSSFTSTSTDADDFDGSTTSTLALADIAKTHT